MQEIIKRYNVRAKKYLGQSFLVDEEILTKISNITNISQENIVEVGPGFGSLTSKILEKKPNSLTLVEIDSFMVNVLNDRIKRREFDIGKTKLEIINGDILKVDLDLKDYKVIANIPYYITSPILFKFLYELKNKPKEMVILMQKEVGDRIVSKKSSVLSLEVKKKCLVTKKVFVSRSAFFPVPKVDSLVLFFQLYTRFDNVPDNKFLSFIKASFSNPRKKMINNLASAGYKKDDILKKLIKLGFSENTRPEELDIDDYVRLLA